MQRISEEQPDIMILDIKMPGIDGIEVLRRVRKAYPRIQVIMLTAHGTEKDQEEAERLGAFAYLRKPVDLEMLTKTMQRPPRDWRPCPWPRPSRKREILILPDRF